MHKALLFGLFFYDRRTVIGRPPAGDLQKIVECIVDFRSNDDLHLAGLRYHAHDIFNALDRFHIHLGFAGVMNAQPRCAAFNKGDVAQSADLFQDLLGHLCIFAHE